MAITETAHHDSVLNKLARAGNAVLSSIEWFFVQTTKNNTRMRQIDFLTSLSDEELKERGLTRDRIVHHVFRDVMSI